MFRHLLLFLLLTSCSKGPQEDLQYISQARSLGYEWALVNELAANGKLTAAYVRTMQQDIREQLGTTASALSQPKSDYGQEIQALLAAPDNAAPAELRVQAGELKQIEDSLESD